MKIIFIFLLALTILPFKLHAQTAPPPLLLTPSQLNKDRALYDGKLIRVIGFVNVGFEHRELHDSKSSYLTGNPFKTCITIVNASKILANTQKYNHKTLILTGLFTSDISKKPYVQIGGCNLTAVDLSNQPAPEIFPGN